jgi:hypothetical protein
MDKEANQQVRTQMKVESVVRRKSLSHLSTWSDNIEVSVNFFALKLEFGEFVSMNPETLVVEIEEKVSIAMSPEHAMTLIGVLEKQIKAYAELYGTIRKPPVAPEQAQAPIPE